MFSLFYPKIGSLKNILKFRSRHALFKILFMTVLALLFWSGIFIILYRVLVYFKSIEAFGDVLATKLLSMLFLTFFSLLIFSNIITALSTFFTSDELQILISSPLDKNRLYFLKYFETMANSSWMVLLFSLPVFITYGMVYNAHPFYYVMILGVMIPFSMICTSIGITLSISLVKVFPAKRLKDILFLLSIFFIIALYFLFRFLQPEKLVEPEHFYTVLDYFASLQAPTSPFLPSQWATDIMLFFLFRNKEIIFNFSMLSITALSFMVMTNWFFNKTFYNAWSKSQESRSSKIIGKNIFNRLLKLLSAPLPPHYRAVILKDIYTFFRDTAQWSQLFILSAIIVIYLYNFSVIPMDKSPFPTIYLQNLIGFLNLGLAGFALAAVAVRFAFPAVSIEGESFWIIKSSPLPLDAFLWCKFCMSFAFLFILAEILIICSNYLLKVDTFMMMLSSVTIALMCFGITGLSIGCGAMYPRFDAENVAKIPTGFGGLTYMMLAVIFIGSVVVIEAWPVYLILMANFTKTTLTSTQWIEIFISFVMVIVINTMAFWIPMKIGKSRLKNLEHF